MHASLWCFRYVAVVAPLRQFSRGACFVLYLSISVCLSLSLFLPHNTDIIMCRTHGSTGHRWFSWLSIFLSFSLLVGSWTKWYGLQSIGIRFYFEICIVLAMRPPIYHLYICWILLKPNCRHSCGRFIFDGLPNILAFCQFDQCFGYINACNQNNVENNLRLAAERL